MAMYSENNIRTLMSIGLEKQNQKKKKKKKKQRKIVNILLPIILAYVLGAQKNRLIETVLLSTHNIYLG